MLREGREARVPLRADDLEPAGRLPQRPRVGAIDRIPPLPRAGDEPRLLEGREVLRDGLSGDRQLVRETAPEWGIALELRASAAWTLA